MPAVGADEALKSLQPVEVGADKGKAFEAAAAAGREAGPKRPADLLLADPVPHSDPVARHPSQTFIKDCRPQTVTFPWWVPKTERITSEISPSVA